MFCSSEEPHAGLLLLLKPTLSGRESVDVLQYASAHPDFPQESTADRFLDEAQWESYRKLGEQIAMKVLEVASGPGLDVHLGKRT